MVNPLTTLGNYIGFEGPTFAGVSGWVKTISIIVGVMVFAALFVFLFFRYRNKKESGTEKRLVWWEETTRGLVPIKEEIAEEVTIPGTNLKLFYVKKSNTWLPRFNNGITASLFYIAITKNREIVNFSLKSIEDDLAQAGLQYDHTDMRWAAENMREFVKRNYRDKAVPWWREYQGVISTAIFIVLMTASLGLIIYLMRGVVQDIGAISAQIADAVEKVQMCSPTTSGIIQQGVG